MSVFLSSGSPSRSVPSRWRSRPSTASATDSCTSSREPAQQTWPWLKKMPFTIPSTAPSTGASSKTMFAALPPSSRVSRLPVPASARWICLADLGRPGERDLVNARMRHQRGAGRPSTGRHVQDSRREPGLLTDLSQQQRGQRGGLGWLEHAGVAGGECGRQLPRGHQQREVPRDHLAGYPQRPGRRPEPGVLQLVGPARVVEEVRRGQRDVDVAGFLDRLAVVEALQHRELAGPLLQQPGDPVQVLGPLGAGHRPPDALVGGARGGNGAVDVGLARVGDLRQRLLGGRVHGRELPPVGSRHELAVDEQPVFRRDRHDVA